MALRQKCLQGRRGVAALAASFVVALSPDCNAQSFSFPGRITREQTVPRSQAPLPDAPVAPAQARSNTQWGPLFKAQVERCWKKPYNAEQEKIEAIFSLRLKRDGSVEDVRAVPGSEMTAYGKVYQASSLRAIMNCQPYDLPQDAYDEWRFFEPVFTERRAR